MTDQMPKPTGLSKPSVGSDDFFNQDFSKFGQPAKNLDVGGGDLAVGLAGSAMRGMGTGIAEIGLSDLVRSGSALSDRLPGSQVLNFARRKLLGESEEEQAAKNAAALGQITGAVTDPIDNAIIKPVVNPIGTAIKAGGEALIENGTSEDYKEALRGRELFTGSGVSDFAISDSAGDPAVWAAKFTDGIGSLGGTLAVGALTGGTVKTLVRKQMLKRGASMELADETARLAGIKWGQRGAMAEGVNMSTGQSADQARSQVDALSWDQLLTSKTFNDQVKEISRDPQFEGASATDLLNEAKRRTADYAASIAKSDPKTWAAAAAGTLLGDAALFKMLQGTGAKGVAAGALQGMAGEGLGEAVEEGTQQYIGNEATNIAGGQNIDPMSGVMQAAATAGTIGALSGGGVGAIGGARGSMAPQDEQSAIGGEQPSDPQESLQASAVPEFDSALAEVNAIERKTYGQHSIGRDGNKFRGAYVDELGNVQTTPAYSKIEDVRAAMGWPVNGPSGDAAANAAQPSGSDDFADTPAFMRKDGERFKGWAADSDVQRALAGEFGASVQEIIAAQMQSGDQGKTLQERVLAGELGHDPFAGGKSAMQVGMDNAPLALPQKDIIYAGDANAKQPGAEVSPPGAFDDKQAGPGPQFRGAERTRWQDGQEGDVLPPESAGNPTGALPGRVIDGESREVGTELPYKPFIAGQDNRAAVSEDQQRQGEQSAQVEQLQNQPKQIGQSGTIFAPGTPGPDNKNSAYTPPRLSRDQIDPSLGEQSTRDPRSPVAQAIEQAGSEQDTIFGQLKSLRITKRGKPFASQKEAQLASRKTETPIALPAGGFGVVDKAELEQVQASQAPVKQLVDMTADPAGQAVSKEPNATVINEGTSQQPSSQEVTDGMPQQLPAPEAVRDETRQDGLLPDDGVAPAPTNTAPASDAGVAVSGVGEKRVTIEPLTDKSIIVKGDKNDAELKGRVEAAWPKAKPLYNERHKGWVFSSKREGVVREALADLLPGDVGDQKAQSVGEVSPKESPASVQTKPAMTNKLRDTGKTLINLGRDKANQPRQSNTPKRASQAASAIRDAENMQTDGETLIKIADAVDAGEAPHLAKLSNKAQYQTLDQLHRRAIPAKHMEGGEYRGYYEGQTEKRRKSGVTVDDYADQIQYPTITAHPDHLRTASKALGEIRGYKGLAGKLSYAARLVSDSERYRPAELDEETAKALAKAAKDTGNRDVKWAAEHVESGMSTVDRLRRMGIDNRDQLVAAIKELDAIQVPRKQESRLQQLERGLVGNKIPGYFNTQGEALNRVMTAADVKPGDEVLEPSAGKGNIADAAKQAGAKVDTVERHNTLREILTEKGHNLIGNDFTQLDQDKLYDKVIMNPPFEQQQDIDHVRKAWNHVKPGGRLVAVMSGGVESNSNRKATEFRQWLDDNGGTMERLPDGSFKDSDRSTGVNTVMVVMDKPNGLSSKADNPSTAEKATPALFSKKGHGLSVDVANRVADDFMREFKGRVPIKVRVAQTQEELYGPGTSREDIGYGIEGSYSPKRGVIGLVSGVLRDEGAARRVLRHEVLGHYGLDTFAPDDKKALLQKLIDAKEEKWIAPIWKQIAGDSVYGAKSELHQAEEVFAHIAEREPKSLSSRVLSDIKATISHLLRKVGLVKGPISQDELDHLIRSIAKGIRSGTRTKQNFRDDQDVIGTDDSDISFSLSDAAPSTRGMTKPELEMVATDWSKQYKGAASARIMVAANQKEMNEVLGMAGAAVPDGQTVNAAYLPGHKTLLLNAEAIQSPKRARELMRHELLAHHGLREVVGDDAYISIIEAVKRGKDIKGIKDAYYQVADNYTDMHPDVQAEEVFAHWIEQQPDRGELAIWWRGIVRRVKDALRAVGLIGERTTEEEFNRVLDAIATGMRNGRQPGRRVMESWHEAPAYSKTADLFTPDRFDAKQFADDVEFASKHPLARREISMGDTPHVLRRLGLDGIEMVMPASVVRKATDPSVRGHYVSLEVLKSLPSHLSDPVAVMRSRTEQNAFVSLIEATDENGDPVIVAIHGNAKGESRIEVNKIASVYGKENTSALQSQLDNGLVYVDKTRAAKWLPTVRLQLPEAGAFQSSGSNKSVLTKDDIRNSGALFSLGSATADQSIIGKAESLAKAAPSSVLNWIKEQRGVGLGALTDLQIDQIYRGVTGGAVSRYQKLRTKMEADRNDILLDAETRIDPLWDALGKEQKKALSNLMHDATMARLHPDLSLADNSLYQEVKQKLDRATKPSTKAKYQAELDTVIANHKHLAERYNLGLNKEGKALYQTMRETYDKQWADLRDAIEQRLEDMMGAEGKTLAAELRLQMEHALQHGPYFPLARFGDYVVKASKGDEHIREHFERRKDAEQAIKQYQRDGYNAVMTVKEEGNGGQANSNALGMKVMQLLDKAGESGASASAIKDDVWQAMLQMLPDASFAKHAIHRRRVKGASRDGHRAYLNSVYHYAHHVSKIRYGHQMQAELNKMNEQIQAGVRGEESNIKPEDLEVAQQVLNEMNKRHELNMNPKGAKWTGWAGNLGFMWYMAGSPASAIINMTQNFTVMLPQLGAKYGFVKASAAMAKALHDYAKHGKFKAGTKEAWVSLTRADSGITSDEKALLNNLYKAGALDLTQAHSVAARADTDLQDVKPGAAWKRKTMAWLGSMFHNAEVLNREVAALAAYRLLKSASPNLTAEQYADQVTEMVYDGHGNYAASNRPRYMRGNVAKVMTQFKIYSQMMTYTLYRNAYLAAKGDKVALKTLGGILGTHFIMAGMMGLPYPVTAALYAIAAAADDDDDRTGEASFRLGLVETLGTGLGELVARGPMDAMTGLSIAGRTGINALWYREPEDGAEGDDLAWHVTQQIVGPVPGIFTQALRGLSMMGNGDYQRGAETMMPKAVKDLMKSYRQFSDGERTRKGDVIIDDVSAFNLAMQAMGFSNAEMAKAYDAREYIKGKEGRIEDARSKLMSDYFMARKDGDEDAMAEVIAQIREFNAIHYRTEAITSRTIRQSLKSKQRSAHRTQGGVYLSRNREYLRGEGAFIGDDGTATN